MKKILYYFDTCPFCVRVLDFISENNLKDFIELRNIYENDIYMQERLDLSINGKQVPCLVIDGKAMLESSDIIKYLSTIK